ncbi:MAG TPA: hypothetical protein VGD71_31035 [Kribbella sp.]|jgi:hypothetical protein
MRFSARRLRRLPAVVLPQAPEQGWLLEAVRRFDPGAATVEGGISFGAGIRLAGPYPITAEAAVKVGLPPGSAWVVSDSGPFETWLVRGLARRFGGFAHLPQPVVADDASEVVIVHTPRQVPSDELGARLPGLTAGPPEDDGSFFLTSPHSPFRVRCDGPDVPSLRWLLPLALGPMRQEPGLHGYRFGSGDGHGVRAAAVAAIEFAQGVGGVATDRDRFRVNDPEDPALYR